MRSYTVFPAKWREHGVVGWTRSARLRHGDGATAVAKVDDGAAHLSIETLVWGPPNGREVLRGVTLAVDAGEVVGIVGPNGAGKSSLLRCVYRFYRPTRGQIRLDGRDIWQMPGRDCARHVAAVLQEFPADFNLTVRQIVLMGRTPHKRPFEPDAADDVRRAHQALDRLDLAHLAHHPFRTLSGGEKQRTLVARALVQGPRLLVIDEPTNHLDIRYQVAVLELVRSLGFSVLASVHDINLAALFCDRLYLLVDGRIRARGTPERVITRDLMREAFGIDVSVNSHPVTGHPQIALHARGARRVTSRRRQVKE